MSILYDVIAIINSNENKALSDFYQNPKNWSIIDKYEDVNGQWYVMKSVSGETVDFCLSWQMGYGSCGLFFIPDEGVILFKSRFNI